MPRVRPKQTKPEPWVPTEAVCIQTLRPVFGHTVEKGQRLPLDHPTVRNFSDHFLAAAEIRQ